VRTAKDEPDAMRNCEALVGTVGIVQMWHYRRDVRLSDWLWETSSLHTPHNVTMTPPERATKSAGRRAGAGARGGAARGRGQRRAPARRGKRHAPHAVDGCARAARARRPRRRSMRAAYVRPIPS